MSAVLRTSFYTCIDAGTLRSVHGASGTVNVGIAGLTEYYVRESVKEPARMLIRAWNCAQAGFVNVIGLLVAVDDSQTFVEVTGALERSRDDHPAGAIY